MFRLAFIALFMGLISNMAHAQSNSVIDVSIGIQCDAKEEMVSVITEKYGEQAFVEAKGMMVILPQRAPVAGLITIWLNIDTKTYSITIESAESSGLMCMLASGIDFAPAGTKI